MLISTANDLPGYEITEVLGEVFGLTVRSRNIGSQFGAGLKSLMGGELKGMTANLAVSRQEVIERMVQRGRGEGWQLHRCDALRHLRDGRHLDRDLRVRHGCQDAEALDGGTKSIEPERREIRVARARRDALRDRLAEAGRVLEPVSGARRDEQHPGEIRVVIDDEVRVGRDGVEAAHGAKAMRRSAGKPLADEYSCSRRGSSGSMSSDASSALVAMSSCSLATLISRVPSIAGNP